MPKYLLLLKHGQFEGYSPEQMQGILEKYMNFTQKLRNEGRYVAAEEISREGRVLKKNGSSIVDGPFTETKEAVGGFYLIEAKSYDEAVKIARDCPHLEFHGEVEVHETIPH